MPDRNHPLVLVSNRGPVTFDEDGSMSRGTGGLDAARADEAGDRPFTVRTPAGGEYHVRLVVSDDDAYDRFYNIFANPMLWFIQHYLWDLSNAPDVRRHEVEAFEYGYNVVNEDLATAVIEEIAGAQ